MTTVPGGESAAFDKSPKEPAHQPLIYSIVLNYNNTVDTDETLETLSRSDYANHVILLVDNGSVDGSPAELRRKWGEQIEYLDNGANLGVAAGYNAGIRAALAAGAGYVVLCNNDIAVAPDLLSSLFRVFQSLPDTGIAGPVMTYYDRSDLIWFGKVKMHRLLAYSIDRYKNRVLSEVNLGSEPYESGWIPTCATMFSSEVLEDVGLLDDRFFFGHDDIDIALRVREAGLVCRVAPWALVRHKVSVTSGIRGSSMMSPRTTYLDSRGSILIGAKHFRGRLAVPFVFGYIFIRVPFKLQGLVRGREWQNLRSYFRGLRSGLVNYGPLFLKEDPG